MATRRCWKVVRVTRSGLKSALVSTRGVEVKYVPGTWTRPAVGRIFVFRSWAEAHDWKTCMVHRFTLRDDQVRIVPCEAKDVQRASCIIDIQGRRRKPGMFAEFWKIVESTPEKHDAYLVLEDNKIPFLRWDWFYTASEVKLKVESCGGRGRGWSRIGRKSESKPNKGAR